MNILFTDFFFLELELLRKGKRLSSWERVKLPRSFGLTSVDLGLLSGFAFLVDSCSVAMRQSQVAEGHG